jgi:asparagine synthase (glutamine-hydrolysing)
MCGILAIYDSDKLRDNTHLFTRAKNYYLPLLKHRGPDGIKSLVINNVFLGHTRLSINDQEKGEQPISNNSGYYLISNGEIYNHKDLKNSYNYKFKTKSDCEVIIPAVLTGSVNLLEGQFAYVVTNGTEMYVGRDPYGICSLYYGQDKEGRVWVSSELKCLVKECVKIEHFMPGTVYKVNTTDIRYNSTYFFPYRDRNFIIYNYTEPFNNIREMLTESVKQTIECMDSDISWGVLLSGGLDSSLVASIASKLVAKGKLKTFSIGFDKNAPDLICARKVAEYIGSEHHEFIVSFEEAFNSIKDVIYHIESYDVTTVRASTPMFLLAKRIREMGVKVCLSGEGSDELFCGYLYFHGAPSLEKLQKESEYLLANLYMFDVLRANKSTMAHSLEIRVPFLNKKFSTYVIDMDPYYKSPSNHGIEKWVLRKSFEGDYLPKEILYRQKEAFSDGCGYNWIDGIKRELSKLKVNEADYYKSIFSGYFKGFEDLSKNKWMPNWTKVDDPSARQLSYHNSK